MMTLLNLFFFFAKCFITEKYCIRRKQRTKKEIFASIVISRVTPRVFFQFKTETGICFLFFFYFLLPSYTLYNIPQLYLSEGAANSL